VRRITYAVMGTISALVALFSYHTSTNSQTSAVGVATSGGASGADTSGGNTSGGSASSGDTSSSSGSGSSSSSSGSGSSSGSSRTFTGDAVDTRWGIVQVEITVKNGKITKSEAIQYPTQNGRDQEINAYAVPQLNSEAVQRQSGSIDAVSGATVTSDGYIQSLQSAIDQANL
jgi:uncharacterized protein with FMN-binding domain